MEKKGEKGMKTYQYEGKNKEEAIDKCLKDLDLSIDQLLIKETEEEGKLFKAKKYIVSCVKKQDIFEFIKHYISQLALSLEISIQVEIREHDGIIQIVLLSDQNSILIGIGGRTLSAIQVLLKQTLSNLTGFNIHLNVDAGNYKSKKLKSLEREITNLCHDVERSKIEAKLDPMNAYERRMVHTIVSEFHNLETESFGEAPERYVVIRFKNK